VYTVRGAAGLLIGSEPKEVGGMALRLTLRSPKRIGSLFWTLSFNGLAGLIITIGLLVAIPVSAQQFTKVPLFAQGEFLVKFTQTYSPTEIDEIAAEYGTDVLEIGTRSGIVRMHVPYGWTAETMMDSYSLDPRVQFAQPNPLMFATGDVEAPFIPDDPIFPFQTNLFLIHMPDAWNIQSGKPGVKVAVLDTGVAFERREIEPDDPLFGLGFTEFVQAPDLEETHFSDTGRDCINDDDHANDDNGHGTFVSGVIAQSTDNGLGSASVAFDTTIVPIKVLNRRGAGNLFCLIEGLHNAIDSGVDVVNMSLGFSFLLSDPAFDPIFLELDKVLQQAHDQGIVLVASTGNDGVGIVSRPALNPNVIAVGASNFDGMTRAFYSQFSDDEAGLGIPPTPGLPGSIEIVAPVGDFTDKDANGIPDAPIHQACDGFADPPDFFCLDPTVFNFFISIGTSFGPPQVAGAAALLIANGQRPSKDGAGVEAIRQILRKTATDLGPSGFDLEFGAGQLDVLAALRTNVPFTAFQIERARVKLDGRASTDRFKVRGSFVYGENSDGIYMLHEDVTVAFDGFTETIPAGSWSYRGDDDEDDDEDKDEYKREFKYKGGSGGITKMKITIGKDGEIGFRVKAKGLDLSGIDLANPVTFALQIGNDYGKADIQFNDKGRFRKRRKRGWKSFLAPKGKDRDDDDDD
jgi:serine protease